MHALLAVALITILFTTPASAQIVNTLRGFDAEPGRSGEVGAYVSATGGNSENVAVSGSLQVQWLSEKHRWRMLADGTRAESRGEVTEESTTAHVRHNARLTGALASVTFVQHQYSPFQRIDSRFLFGAGMRWDLRRTESLEVAVGVTPMLEIESLEGTEDETGGRLSSFVSVLGKLDERTTVDLSGFVQPAFDDGGDLRAIGSASLRVEISSRFAVVTGFQLEHDSRPAPGVERTDWKSRSGLHVTL